MRIIISPAKKMCEEYDIMEVRNEPMFIDKADKLLSYLKTISFEKLKEILSCNDSIADLNFHRYRDMDLYKKVSPSILSYDGIQYTYMAPKVFEYKHFEYVEENLRILSGLYGVLRPLDGVVPYRLEMSSKFITPFCKNLYDFWGNSVYKALADETDLILNLASKEYSKLVEKHVTKNIKIVTCIFGELLNGKIVEKGVYAKMARGKMVRYMAENQIDDLEKIKYFDGLGYKYEENLSNDKKYVFIKQNKE